MFTPPNREINFFMDKMDNRDKKELWEMLALAIYTSGAPMSMVEQPHWIAFFKKLRPSFVLPTRKMLSTDLLDKANKKIEDEVKTKIGSAKAIGVQCDGWSNVRNEGIVNFVVTTPSPVSKNICL